jgi:hypothetical protein
MSDVVVVRVTFCIGSSTGFPGPCKKYGNSNWVGVGLGVGDGELVGVGVGTNVSDGVGVGNGVPSGVEVGGKVEEGVGVGNGVPSGVGDGVGVDVGGGVGKKETSLGFPLIINSSLDIWSCSMRSLTPKALLESIMLNTYPTK